MADMDAIMAIAAQHGLLVIEDAAQAHGADWQGQGAGSMGAIGCFSFYPGKNLGAYGEGGGTVTNDPALAERMRMLRDWGQEERYNHAEHGFNYRMDGIQGAILSVKLRASDALDGAPRARSQPSTTRCSPSYRCSCPQSPRPWNTSTTSMRFAIRTAIGSRAGLDGSRRGDGHALPVRCICSQPMPTSAMAQASFPVAEALAAEFLSLPIFPELTREQQVTSPARCVPSSPCLDDQPCRVKPATLSTRGHACRHHMPCHRRSRLHRLAYRRPAAGRRRGGGIVSSTTWSAGGATTSPRASPAAVYALIEGDIRDPPA